MRARVAATETELRKNSSLLGLVLQERAVKKNAATTLDKLDTEVAKALLAGKATGQQESTDDNVSASTPGATEVSALAGSSSGTGPEFAAAPFSQRTSTTRWHSPPCGSRAGPGAAGAASLPQNLKASLEGLFVAVGNTLKHADTPVRSDHSPLRQAVMDAKMLSAASVSVVQGSAASVGPAGLVRPPRQDVGSSDHSLHRNPSTDAKMQASTASLRPGSLSPDGMSRFQSQDAARKPVAQKPCTSAGETTPGLLSRGRVSHVGEVLQGSALVESREALRGNGNACGMSASVPNVTRSQAGLLPLSSRASHESPRLPDQSLSNTAPSMPNTWRHQGCGNMAPVTSNASARMLRPDGSARLPLQRAPGSQPAPPARQAPPQVHISADSCYGHRRF